MNCKCWESIGREWRNSTFILMTQTVFLLHCQVMRVVHLQTTKYSGALKESLKKHPVKIYLPNTCSVLLNIICITASFVECCVAVGLLTRKKKKKVNFQEVQWELPKVIAFETLHGAMVGRWVSWSCKGKLLNHGVKLFWRKASMYTFKSSFKTKGNFGWFTLSIQLLFST